MTEKQVGKFHMSRRGVIGIGATSLLSGLTACAQGGGGEVTGGPSSDPGFSSAGPSDPIRMNTALWGNADRAATYEEAIELFLESQDNLSIDLTFSELGPYLERLATQAAGGSLPDVMWMRDTHIGWFGSTGALLDLSPYLGNHIDTADIGDAAVADGTVDGGVFALPTHYVGQAILYNIEALADLGVGVGDVSTWADLAELAREAAGYLDNGFGISDATLDTSHRHFEAWIRQAGEELFTPDGGLGFSKATAEAWFEFWGHLRADGILPDPGTQIEAQVAGLQSSMLAIGRSVIQLNSSNHLSIINSVSEAQLGIGSVPAHPDATDDWWFFPPILISAAANSAHPEIAAELINFFINDVPGGEITGLSQGTPSSAAVRDAIMPSLDDDQRAFVEQISREQELPRRPFPVRPQGSEEVNTLIRRVGEEMAYQTMSISEGVDMLMADGTAALGSAQ